MDIKKIKNLFKLEVLCGGAKFEDPGIGPNLSPYMVRDKINLFCAEVNQLTNTYNNELRIGVKLFLYMDNSFFFCVKGPNFTNLVKLFLNCDSLIGEAYNVINLCDLFDLVYFKKLFMLNSGIKYNNLVLKMQIKNSIHSIKNLKVINVTPELSVGTNV